MTTSAQHISWLGAGWLANKPAATSWLIFGIGVVLGLALIFVSYRFTLVAMAPWRRSILSLLRFGMWLALLLCLAAPASVERTYDHPDALRSLAVLVDRSDSMTVADNRGHRRLDDALLKWQQLQPGALKAFRSLKSFAFAQGMLPVANPAESVKLPGGRTDLFASLQSTLGQAPSSGWGGIVALTDGLDTSGADLTEAERTTVRAALRANTPLYFVIGHNRTVEPPFFRIREFNVPAETTPQTIIRIEAEFESYETDALTVPVQLKVNGDQLPATILRLDPGRHLETWTAEQPAPAPGLIDLQLRAGSEVARAEVRIQLPASNRILYDEGALDWGYRFLSNILSRGGTFHVTPVFDFPNAGIALPPGAIEHPPFSAAGLQPFGIVILANVDAAQIPTVQQEALTRWVSDGGILVFLAPDDDAAQGFAGSELEQMLPVVFKPPTTQSVSVQTAPSVKPAALIPFAWEDTLLIHQIFANSPGTELAQETPRFLTYAHVERAKPGAEVLARHPNQAGPDGRGAILLAVQRYGQGKSVVFTTDALWRWKLGESSEDRDPELFWENLFSWLVRDREPGLHFDHPPLVSPVDHDVTVHVVGAGTGAVLVEASLADRSIAGIELPANEDARAFRLRLPAGGLWEVLARDASGSTARAWISVSEAMQPGELSGAAPDENLLRTLADETGGAVLEGVPLSWSAKGALPQLLVERRQPLWDRTWVFGMLLGLYGTELILRRRWSLL